jgi:hypothetical protein
VIPSIDPASPGNLALVLVLLVSTAVVLFANAWKHRASEPTPLEALVRNLERSALPIPARNLVLAGSAVAPPASLGRCTGAVFAPHVVALVVRPNPRRAGWRALTRRKEIVVVPRSDVGQVLASALVLRGTGAMQIAERVLIVYPDFSDDEVRARWAARTAPHAGRSVPKADPALETERDRETPNRLSAVHRFYLDALEALLAVQEEAAHIDLNARMRRAIPFDERDPPSSNDAPAHEPSAGPDDESEAPP